jgi:hypothetical protein
MYRQAHRFPEGLRKSTGWIPSDFSACGMFRPLARYWSRWPLPAHALQIEGVPGCQTETSSRLASLGCLYRAVRQSSADRRNRCR